MVDLNDFQYDSKRSWYESKLEINGRFTGVYVCDEDTKDIEILKDRLNKGIDWIENNYEKILNYCADNLLELKNESWLDLKEEEVTKQAFKEKLQLESIEIWDDGKLEISFRDGDLFDGHWIVADIDREYNLCDVNIEG